MAREAHVLIGVKVTEEHGKELQGTSQPFFTPDYLELKEYLRDERDGFKMTFVDRRGPLPLPSQSV